MSPTPVAVDWQNRNEAGFGLDELEREPAVDARFGSLPAEAAKAKSYAAWSRDFVAWLYGSQALESALSPATEVFETVSVRLKKANITVRLVALSWVPYWQDLQGNLQPAS